MSIEEQLAALTQRVQALEDQLARKRSKAFQPPTALEVREYSVSIGKPIDAEAFVDFYESKGWLVGKSKMKCWKSAVRNWAKNSKNAVGLSAKNSSLINQTGVTTGWIGKS
jgi:hypothetical protein